MNDEKAVNYLVIWKNVAFGLAIPILIKVLHFWLPEPVSWGLGIFLSSILYYETPPKLRVGSFFTALLCSAAGGLMAAIGAYVSAK